MIERREFLGAMALAAARPARAQGNRAPNIVFFLADDLGWGDLGCYGNARIRTPNLDRMAKQGTLFTQFYASGPVCSPSRCGFMTGRFPGRLGIHSALGPNNQVRGQADFLDPQVPTIARVLQQAGYATAHFGKWHLGDGEKAPDPREYGLDERITANTNDNTWNKRDPYFRANSTSLIVDAAIRFIEKNRERPFYVNAWSLLPHAPLNPTDEQMKPYRQLGPAGLPYKGALEVYAASVTAIDEQFGRLMARLDALGLAGDTVVVFSSDNGPEDIHLREASHSGVGAPGPFRGRKRSLYEGGIRMPFLVRWPGHVAAGRVDRTSVVSGVDFLPSMAALARAPLPAGLEADGEDRGRVLLGTPAPRSKPLFWEWRLSVFGDTMHRSPMLATRSGDWKLLMNPDRGRVELYDIPRDSLEVNNQAAARPDVAERLAGPLLAWQKTLPQGPLHPQAGRNDYPWPGGK